MSLNKKGHFALKIGSFPDILHWRRLRLAKTKKP